MYTMDFELEIELLKKNLKMSFFHRATRSSSNSNDDGNVKNARKWHHKSDDDDIDVVKVKELPPKILKNAKKHGKNANKKKNQAMKVILVMLKVNRSIVQVAVLIMKMMNLWINLKK